MHRPFRNRAEAGRILAGKLSHYAGRDDVLVLGLPRGGAPVAYEIARALRSPLDVFLVRKLGVPGEEELAMGAIASGGVRILNQDVVDDLQIPAEVVDRAVNEQTAEMQRREVLYRSGRPPLEVTGKVIILVDDGLATGATMRAAVAALRQGQPRSIVIAVPVAAAPVCEAMRPLVDEVVCFLTPETFYAVGLWYELFDQTTDDEVRDLLKRSSSFAPPLAEASPASDAE